MDTGDHLSLQINFLPLLCGRTLKGCVFGGIKTISDLPILLEKCRNKIPFCIQLIFSRFQITSHLWNEFCCDNICSFFSLGNPFWWTHDSWSSARRYKQSIWAIEATRLCQGFCQDLIDISFMGKGVVSYIIF